MSDSKTRKDAPVFSGVLIPITQGQVTLVDEEDYLLVLKYKWCAWYNKCTDSFYAKTTSRGMNGKKAILNLHRYLLGVTDPKILVDHINGDTLDNRRCNLRPCNASQNTKNKTRLLKLNTSGYRGVCWSKEKQKWKAYIHVDGKHKHLLYSSSPIEAAKTFDNAAKEYYGEFCGKLNLETEDSNG